MEQELRNEMRIFSERMKYKILFIAVLLTFSLYAPAQNIKGMILPAIINGSDTIGVATLPEFTIVSKRIYTDPVEQYRFNQLKKNVYIVYPYAKEAGKIFNELNQSLADKNRKRDQRKYLKQKEEELDAQFADQLKNLTTTQGEILVKLIARETGQNCYTLIREFKNPLSAFFWQNAGKLFGYNLKITYNPQQDADIELIVRSIENDW